MPSTYTQGYDAATLASHQSRSAEAQADYLIPHIKPHFRILDIGCGPGTITCDFAKYVPQGSVTGVDFSEEVLAQARAEAERRGVGTTIHFQPASALELPFEEGSFDVVHCHALLVHVPHAAEAVKEMRRVCKTGGIVAAREPVWDTTVIHPHNPLLEKWKVVGARLKVLESAEPDAGKYLAEWAIAAGFEWDKVKVSCNVLEYSGSSAQWWGELTAKRARSELYARAIKAELMTEEEVEQVAAAYAAWGRNLRGGPIWAMMHMRLLAVK
ncbi:putative ubiE/COQ5 methyltransferase [Neohortaea acidophila]|uniref:Putative ubiE/COQ5 methyltransferase n=1 Tax=Neohortaea acidophila TaxID=245834 RepID=A0A6A6PRJ2_9PEZI|nr:putative ubiE/COQ5 methyltransferase [Neohortaea acidophila]KAF2482416.1 putative ubiE/COQ5 methyltransferase [Neohortaea acidophila]